MRQSSVREFTVFPQAWGQIGYPATMSTDVSLGFSPMTYQSAVIAMTKCFLARFERTAAKTREAPKTDVVRRAKVGCCPCCARATHAAISPMYQRGKYSLLRAVVGSRARRSLAACKFAKDFGELSNNRHVAAQYLHLPVPEPLARPTPPEDPPHVRGIEPIMKSKTLNYCV